MKKKKDLSYNIHINKKNPSTFNEDVAKLGQEIKELDLITKIDLEENNKVLLNAFTSIIGIVFLIAVVTLVSTWVLMFKL